MAGWSLRYPIFAVVGWITLVVLCVLGGDLAGTHKATDIQLTAGQAGRAAQLIAAAGLDQNDTESVLISSPSGARLTATGMHGVEADTQAVLDSLPVVKSVAPLILSAAHAVARVSVELVADASADNAPLRVRRR